MCSPANDNNRDTSYADGPFSLLMAAALIEAKDYRGALDYANQAHRVACDAKMPHRIRACIVAAMVKTREEWLNNAAYDNCTLWDQPEWVP